MAKPQPVALPNVGDLAFHLLIILGRTTRPFRPADVNGAVREALGNKYNCDERVWRDRIRAAKDLLVNQGFLEIRGGFWASTEAGRVEAEIIRRIQES